MKTTILRFVSFLSFVILFSSNSFAADIYLKITDVKGESKIVSCPNGECAISDLAVGDYTIQQTDAKGNAVTTPLVLDHEIVSPRDSASGLPTGKRMHKPMMLLNANDAGEATVSITVPNSTLKAKDHNSSRSNKTGSK